MNRIYFLRHFFLSLVLITVISYSGYATHLRAGEITVERVDCNALTFRITVTVFTNTINTNVLFGGEDDWLDFGDGNRELVPETENTLRPDLGEGIATASYTRIYTYSGNGRYVISYSEPNRNAGVVNMDGSVNTRFYIETLIIIDPFLGCNNTPKLLIPPIDRACKGIAWEHNPGAYDPDRDSISYELVIPFRDNKTTVVNYRAPNHTGFYANYATGNEAGTGTPNFEFDTEKDDGTLTWDAPGTLGEYNIAFIVREWRKLNGVWISIGFVRRDMQIIVDDCENEKPELEIPQDICVEAGSIINETIFGTDPDGDSVKIEAFSEIFNFPANESPATYSPNPPRFVSQPAQLQFQWNTECAHVSDLPYQVVFKITDLSPTGSRLANFKTWLIRVVGPEPEWVSATTDLATRSANLEWDPYICQNAESIQIWRKVDSFPFSPDSCQTGMPEGLGYTLINTVPVNITTNNVTTPVTTFTDTNQGMGLASGAQYCYRLVAVFPRPNGGESYVSEEICLDPILADRAIITNVTVDRTRETDGQITVKWIAPYEADPGQFPPPYTYQVARAEGFTGDGNLEVLGTTANLTYTDVGINTDQKVYNYKITAVASNGTLLDPSAAASSVRLEADSQLDKIQLTWSAAVPWSNQREAFPNKHHIYRGPEGAADDQLELYDSVEVTTAGFIYVDDGQPGVPLEDIVYCYKVMTRGGYGNPQIAEPLINFSQVICAQKGDDVPPCAPDTPRPFDAVDCDAYASDPLTCNNNLFTNQVRWTRTADECGNDISYYKIWVASSSSSTFAELPIQIRDTVFVDENLPSFARCYKIQAVDRSGNRSELSEAVCFDNCPYYELPNIFTPNDDGCNDFFSAFSDRNFSGEEVGGTLCTGGVPAESQGKCARFVDKVFVRIYNRWGKEVFSYESGGERTIYIDWDGRDMDGRDLASGVYFYVADVTFDSVDPEKQNQVIKGWVHLLR